MSFPSMKGGDVPAFDIRSLSAIPGEGRTISKYRPDKVIIAQGELDDCTFYILQGKVKLEFVADDGRQAVLAILGADEFFGQNCLAGVTRRRFSVCAITESVVARLEKPFVQRLLKENPEFAELFVSFLLRRVMLMQEEIISLLVSSSRKRLARLLLVLACDQADPSESISPHISHEVLSEMVGTTRSRVNEFMNEFRRSGYIDYNANGNLHVHSTLVQVLLQK